MCPQIACMWWCKVTLVAFDWLFSTVRFQMSPQIACAFEKVPYRRPLVWIGRYKQPETTEIWIVSFEENMNNWTRSWPMAWIRDQINNFSKSDNLSLKDVGTDHNFVIDQQREWLFSLRKVILMPSRITFLIEKSNSCVIENYWILYKYEKSNSRRNENCNQRELLSFFRSKIGRNK